jgi:hypothetical protein
MKYQRLDSTEPHPIDVALSRHLILAACGDRAPALRDGRAKAPEPPLLTRMRERP